MLHDSYLSIFLTHGDDRGRFDSLTDVVGEAVGSIHDVAKAAVILRHLDETAVFCLGQFIEILRVGAPKLIDVLVIIAYGYHPHLFVGFHQSRDKGIIILAHVLRLIDNEHSLADAIGFNFSIADHFGGLLNHISSLIQIANPAQQVEAVGMEGLDFYEMGGIADELQQSLLEFGSGCTRESEHQELFVLYIFQQQERGKLMYEHTCLAAARTGSDYDAAGLMVIDDFLLSLGEHSEEFLILRRCYVALYLSLPVSLEVF